MTLKDDWDTGDVVTAADINAISAQANATQSEADSLTGVIDTFTATGLALASATDAAAAREALDVDNATATGTALITAVDAPAARVAINADYYVNAKDFGATGDGTTDDTDALQDWVEHLVTNGLSGWLPKGEYKITDTITIPSGYHWSITGDGRPIIKQYANNVPVIQIGTTDSGFSHSWTIENFDLYYNTQQTTSDTSGNHIVFEGAAPNTSFHGTIRRMDFRYGYYAMKTAGGGKFNLWGSNFDDLHCRFMSGGFYDNSAALAAGAPNNQWGNCTLYCDDAVGPMFKSWSAGQMSVGNLEFLVANQGPQLITCQSPFSADIGSIRLEVATYTTGKFIIELGASCGVRINTVDIGGTPSTFSPASGQLVAFSRLGGAGFLDINTFSLAGETVTGTCVAINGGDVTNRCRVGNLRKPSGWGVHWGGGTASGNYVTVDNWVNNALSDDKGDADYTVALGDPNVVVFNTAFTAQRTITLPTKSGNDNCAGLYYDLIFSGAINASNTALIKEGAVTLRTQSTDGVRLRYAWRRSAWVLVDVADLTAATTTYTPTNVSTDRAFDADATTVEELADVVGTLIADLKTKGIITP